MTITQQTLNVCIKCIFNPPSRQIRQEHFFYNPQLNQNPRGTSRQRFYGDSQIHLMMMIQVLVSQKSTRRIQRLTVMVRYTDTCVKCIEYAASLYVIHKWIMMRLILLNLCTLYKNERDETLSTPNSQKTEPKQWDINKRLIYGEI